MSILTENIRDGVPIASPVILSSYDILSLFKNTKEASKAIDDAEDKLRKYLETLGPISDIEFFQTMEVATDSKTLEKRIVLSPSALISTIAFNLNIKEITEDKVEGNFTTTEISTLMENYTMPKLKKLRSLTKENELEREFPSLYLKFNKHKQMMKNLKYLVKNMKHLSVIEKVKLKSAIKLLGYNDINELLKSNPQSVQEFSENYANTVETWTTHIPEIIDYMSQIEVDFKNLAPRNQEKLELYLVSQFLRATQTYGKDSPQRFLIFIANYFKKHPEKKTDDKLQITYGRVENEKIGLLYPGTTVSAKSLYEEYKQFIVSHPEVQLLTFDRHELDGMGLQEAEEYVSARLEDIQANWSFLPKEDFDRIVITSASGIREKASSEEEKRKKQERLLELFMDKKEFYEQTDPFFRIKGENTFNGYIGYIYSNGKVILDKFFENAETGKVADGQAIYTMNFSDFARLSILPKSELINNPSCRRIVHAGNWQSRVTEEITSDTETTNSPSAILNKLYQEGKVIK